MSEELPSSEMITPQMRREINRWIVQAAFGMIGYGLVLFFVAGRVNWLWGWLMLIIVVIFMAAHPLILVPINPALLVEREKGIRVQGVKEWDKWLAPLAAGLPIAGWIIAGVGLRLNWTQGFPLWVRIVALFVNICGYALFLWAMASNAFFAEGVRIQEERGHQAVSGGPYRFIRHPGYAGAILAAISTPLILGSWWALIPCGISALMYALRTYLEDNTLKKELAGYLEYTEQTRSRLIPGIW
jgi:protein-S-isoprenylcysteine O-methyltransferase Ste14